MTRLQICSTARPHMRAFHLSWLSFFVVCCMWFAIPPLIGTIAKPPCVPPDSPTCQSCAVSRPSIDLGLDASCRQCEPNDARLGAGCGGVGLTQQDIASSNLLSVCGTILIRFLVGPITEQLGPRATYTYLLICMSVPGFFASLVTTAEAFVLVRFFISFAGGAFVVTQIWTTSMFHSNCIGLATSTTAGWGNLGGGVTQLAIGALFALLLSAGITNDSAWRACLLVPPLLLLAAAWLVFFHSDDTPFGRAGAVACWQPQHLDRFLRLQWSAARSWRTWVLFLAYSSTFGVELVINGNIALYLQTEFDLDQTTASVCGSTFGMCNIFARSLGGFLSDMVASRFADDQHALAARAATLWVLQSCLGTVLTAFTFCTPTYPGLPMSLGLLIVLATMTFMGNGAVFSLVPLVLPEAVGGVAGIVGAGGNVGAVVGNALLGASTMRLGLRWLGVCSVAASLALAPLVFPILADSLCSACSACGYDCYASRGRSNSQGAGAGDADSIELLSLPARHVCSPPPGSAEMVQ